MTRSTWLATIAFVLAVGMVSREIAADEPAALAPQWFKGNLHTHSLWSDGNDFPEMICDWYQKAGYQFLALSDHNILSEGGKWIDVEAAAKRGAIGGLERYRERFGGDWVETRELAGKQQVKLKPLNDFRKLFEEPGKFLMLQGEEITDHFGSLPIHVNASNIRDLIKPQGGGSVRETIANNLIAVQQQSQRVGQPMLAHLNHPNYGYAVTAEDMAAVIQERFFEVYNGHPGVNHSGDKHHVSMEQMWDVANTIRIAELKSPPLFGLATDDSHNYFGNRDASPGRGWIMVRAKRLVPSDLIASITRGDFYASSGVVLRDVRCGGDSGDNRSLEIEIAAQVGQTFVTEFIGTKKGYDNRSQEVVGDDGKPINATRRYSADVGKVLAKVDGSRPSYKLTGDELYVRAVVTSSAAAANPSFKSQRQQAWTQPLGWEKWIAAEPAATDGAK